MSEYKQDNTNWKVKIYLLNVSGGWDDCGTGILQLIKEMNKTTELEQEYLCVSANEDSTQCQNEAKLTKLRNNYKGDQKVLLYHQIDKSNEYDKQGDTIITCQDKNISEEIAISFLDHIATNKTWQHICYVIGKNPCEFKQLDEKQLEQLQMPNLENIKTIYDLVQQNLTLVVQAIIQKPEFLEQLKVVFDDFEDLEQNDQLPLFYFIIKLLIFSNDRTIIEKLMSNEYYLMSFGALEYKKENLAESKIFSYRDDFKNNVKFKQIIQFDEHIIQKIQLNYRYAYLRDCILASYIEDAIINSINILIFQNQTEILSYLLQNEKLLQQLLDHFSVNTDDAVTFLLELLTISKSNQEKFETVISQLVKLNIYDKLNFCLESYLVTDEQAERPKRSMYLTYLLEIISLVALEAKSFVQYILSPAQKVQANFINKLFLLYAGDDISMQQQINEILKIVLDPALEKKNWVVDHILEHFLKPCLQHISQNADKQLDGFITFFDSFSSLLQFCIRNHSIKMSLCMVNQKILQNIYTICRTRNKTIDMNILKIMKAIIEIKDKRLIKYILDNQLLDELIKIFYINFLKENILCSLLLELQQIIIISDIPKLVQYIMNFDPQKISCISRGVPVKDVFPVISLNQKLRLDIQKSNNGDVDSDTVNTDINSNKQPTDEQLEEEEEGAELQNSQGKQAADESQNEKRKSNISGQVVNSKLQTQPKAQGADSEDKVADSSRNQEPMTGAKIGDQDGPEEQEQICNFLESEGEKLKEESTTHQDAGTAHQKIQHNQLLQSKELLYLKRMPTILSDAQDEDQNQLAEVHKKQKNQ